MERHRHMQPDILASEAEKATRTLPSPFAISRLMRKAEGLPVTYQEVTPRDVRITLASKYRLNVHPRAKQHPEVRLVRDEYPDVDVDMLFVDIAVDLLLADERKAARAARVKREVKRAFRAAA